VKLFSWACAHRKASQMISTRNCRTQPLSPMSRAQRTASFLKWMDHIWPWSSQLPRRRARSWRKG